MNTKITPQHQSKPAYIGPCPRHIQLAVDECTAAMTGIAEEYADLAILDSARRAAVLALHAGRVLTFLDETSFVHDQHCITLAESFTHVLAQYIARGVGVPLCPLEQVLHAVRCCLANPFGKLPAVLALDCAQQPLHIRQ